MENDSFIGRPVDALATPCLVVDVETLDRNLRRMADFFADRPCKLRPHFKSHKCVTLARRQLATGAAVGITCAKLSEAEVLVAGGVDDVLIANQIVRPEKARRVAELNRNATVRVAIDSESNAAELGLAAREAGVTIGALVEVDIGMNRCGVAPGEPALRLAETIAKTEGLRFDGLQGYEGHLITIPDPDIRARRTRQAMGLLVETRRALEANGPGCAMVSGGGTGTYDITGVIDGIDEIQAGTYALMDASYKRVRPEFECAANVLATVISANGRKAVLDVGVKGLGCEFGDPEVSGAPQAKVLYVAEEHVPIDDYPAAVGDRVRLIASHGCTTANLYRQMWIARDGVIEACWPIEGSGRLE